RPCSGATTCFDIGLRIPNGEGCAQINSPLPRGGKQQSRPGFSTITSISGSMRADVEISSIDPDTTFTQLLGYGIIEATNSIHIKQAAANATLIGNYQQNISGALNFQQSRYDIGIKHGIAKEVWIAHIQVQDTVAVEKNSGFEDHGLIANERESSLQSDGVPSRWRSTTSWAVVGKSPAVTHPGFFKGPNIPTTSVMLRGPCLGADCESSRRTPP